MSTENETETMTEFGGESEEASQDSWPFADADRLADEIVEKASELSNTVNGEDPVGAIEQIDVLASRLSELRSELSDLVIPEAGGI